MNYQTGALHLKARGGEFKPRPDEDLFLAILTLAQHEFNLILSVLHTKPDICANSVNPDKTAHKEPSYQDLHCLLFYFDV